MENNPDNKKEQTGEQEQVNDVSSTGAQGTHHHKGGIHNNALYAAGMGRSAVSSVNPHSNSGLSETGTNTSYDTSYQGPVAYGSGHTAGMGYTPATGGTHEHNNSAEQTEKTDLSGENKTEDKS